MRGVLVFSRFIFLLLIEKLLACVPYAPASGWHQLGGQIWPFAVSFDAQLCPLPQGVTHVGL